MKRHIKLLILAVILTVTAVFAVSCSQWDTPYEDLDKNGYTLSVKFDANGGVFAGTNDVTVIDVFNLDNHRTNDEGMKEIYLLNPNDPLRQERAYEVTNNGYFLAGWYTERTPRVDENNNPLDDYGMPTSETNKPQGYTYSGKWDFDADTLKVDPSKTYSSTETYITLYAAWVPYYTYEFYAENEESGAFEKYATYESISLQIPEWNEKTGKIDMYKFPARTGMTFQNAYLTEDMNEALAGTIEGKYDPETATVTNGIIKVYTEWKSGDWFKISTPQQFIDNSRLGGCYEILNDLDFSGLIWSNVIASGNFSGTIVGNGHTISNVTISQKDAKQMYGGLFGALDSTATISDLSFENITYTIEHGFIMQGASYGLLAGTVNDGATLENVSVSGTINISTKANLDIDYSLGLVCGNCLNAESVKTDNITINALTSENDEFKFVFDIADNGAINITKENNS